MPTLALTDVIVTVKGRVQHKQSLRKKKKLLLDLRGSKETWSMRNPKKLRELHEGVKFVKNLVIEEPEHGLLFIDAFGDEAFQRAVYPVRWEFCGK
nr:hypothetical protein [Tanacetum cinerariifolium]